MTTYLVFYRVDTGLQKWLKMDEEEEMTTVMKEKKCTENIK